MTSLLITPASEAELQLLTELLKRMNIATRVFSDEEKEDLGLALLMREVQDSPLVSREEVMRKLGRA